MNDQPRRRLMDRSTAAPTLVGADSKLNGTFICPSGLVVAGEIIGNAVVTGSLTLAEEGKWRGELQATDAIISGEFNGDILIAERLEIRKSARISGTIRAKTIAIETGAVVDGEMIVTSGKPPVRFEEKRNK